MHLTPRSASGHSAPSPSESTWPHNLVDIPIRSPEMVPARALRVLNGTDERDAVCAQLRSCLIKVLHPKANNRTRSKEGMEVVTRVIHLDRRPVREPKSGMMPHLAGDVQAHRVPEKSHHRVVLHRPNAQKRQSGHFHGFPPASSCSLRDIARVSSRSSRPPFRRQPTAEPESLFVFSGSA